MKKRYGLKASFTVEAALVLPLCLLCVLSLIHEGIEIHEQVFAEAFINETLEKLSHCRDEEEKQTIEEEIRASVRNRLDDFQAEEYKDGNMIQYYKNSRQGIMKDKGFRPEKLLRGFTLIEDLTDK